MNYRLEVDSKGALIVVTEYDHGLYTCWTATHVIMVDEMLYFISL